MAFLRCLDLPCLEAFCLALRPGPGRRGRGGPRRSSSPPPPPLPCVRRVRGQEAKTPLAVVNEYAARLVLRLELEEGGAPEAGVFTGER